MWVTAAPQVMWSTDSVRVFTVDGGWVWTFAAVGPLKRRVRGLAGVQVCVVDSRTAPNRETVRWGRRERPHRGVGGRARQALDRASAAELVAPSPAATRAPPRHGDRGATLHWADARPRLSASGSGPIPGHRPRGSARKAAVRRPQPASLERLDDATGALVGVVRGRIIVHSRSSPFGIVGGRGWGARPS